MINIGTANLAGGEGKIFCVMEMRMIGVDGRVREAVGETCEVL